MINVIDNFFEKDIHKAIFDRVYNSEFSDIELGDRKFCVQDSFKNIDELALRRIKEIEGIDRRCVLSFFRAATDVVDTDWNIHADSIVNMERPDRAMVVYLSPSQMEGLHGTAFWKHKQYGHAMPDYIAPDIYDDVLRTDLNDLGKWELDSVVGYKENRAVSYPCSYFHSKYPNKGWPDGRIVYVIFYK